MSASQAANAALAAFKRNDMEALAAAAMAGANLQVQDAGLVCATVLYLLLHL